MGAIDATFLVLNVGRVRPLLALEIISDYCGFSEEMDFPNETA